MSSTVLQLFKLFLFRSDITSRDILYEIKLFEYSFENF